MILRNAGKTIEFNIKGYEDPDWDPSLEEFDYSMSRLTFEVKYTYRKRTYTYQDDEGLMAADLEEITESLEDIIEGKEASYIFDFMETNLQLAMAKFDKKIGFIFQFIYDVRTRASKTRKIAVLLSHEEAMAVLDEFKAWVKKYPVR